MPETIRGFPFVQMLICGVLVKQNCADPVARMSEFLDIPLPAEDRVRCANVQAIVTVVPIERRIAAVHAAYEYVERLLVRLAA